MRWFAHISVIGRDRFFFIITGGGQKSTELSGFAYGYFGPCMVDFVLLDVYAPSASSFVGCYVKILDHILA